jgi:hypothetical protein
MQHKEPSYIRKGKTIRCVADGSVETFKSISQAKRRSLQIQLSSGGRGMGCVRVER